MALTDCYQNKDILNLICIPVNTPSWSVSLIEGRAVTVQVTDGTCLYMDRLHRTKWDSCQVTNYYYCHVFTYRIFFLQRLSFTRTFYTCTLRTLQFKHFKLFSPDKFHFFIVSVTLCYQENVALFISLSFFVLYLPLLFGQQGKTKFWPLYIKGWMNPTIIFLTLQYIYSFQFSIKF